MADHNFADDIEALEKEIKRHAKSAQIPDGLKEEFCENWDSAKGVLEILRRYLPEGTAQIILTIIVKAGDATHEEICEKK